MTDPVVTINEALIDHEANTFCYKFNENTNRKEILLQVKDTPEMRTFLKTCSIKLNSIQWGDNLLENMDLHYDPGVIEISDSPSTKVVFRSTNRFVYGG